MDALLTVRSGLLEESIREENAASFFEFTLISGWLGLDTSLIEAVRAVRAERPSLVGKIFEDVLAILLEYDVRDLLVENATEIPRLNSKAIKKYSVLRENFRANPASWPPGAFEETRGMLESELGHVLLFARRAGSGHEWQSLRHRIEEDLAALGETDLSHKVLSMADEM